MSVRYKRSSIDSTIKAAVRLSTADNTLQYVFATALGYTIAKAPPPGQQSHYVVMGNQISLFTANREGDGTDFVCRTIA